MVRVKFIATNRLKNIRKISNQQLNFTIKKHEKEEQTKPKVSRRKEIIKLGAEINEIENRKIVEKNQ